MSYHQSDITCKKRQVPAVCLAVAQVASRHGCSYSFHQIGTSWWNGTITNRARFEVDGDLAPIIAALHTAMAAIK